VFLSKEEQKSSKEDWPTLLTVLFIKLDWLDKFLAALEIGTKPFDWCWL